MAHFRFHATASVVALAALIASPALAGDLAGVITNADAEARLEGVRVSLNELGRTTTTDRDGAYRFFDVPAGDYTLTLAAVGASAETLSVTLTEEDAELDIAFGAQADVDERIVVVGQRGSLFDALNQKRASSSIIDVLSADAIGQFPDENVSESVRRVAGVLVANDQGEGRFVTIRGLNPELNATSINGVRIPAPENDIRGVALDVIDSEVLEGITINKSLTPDMDGDAIGGSIDIKTTSAFDRGEGAHYSGEIGGSFNELSEKVGPKFGAEYTNLYMDGRLGVALTGSYRFRAFESDNQEVDGPWVQDEDSGLLYNEELELRDYIITRERTNLAANFDFRPNANHDLYFRTLFSEFEDDEHRQRVELKLEDAEIASVAGDVLTFQGVLRDGEGALIDEDTCEALDDADLECQENLIEIDRDSKDRLETQKIWSFQLGGESRLDRWTLDYRAAFSHAEEEEPAPGNLDTITFRGEFFEGETIGFGAGDLLNPQIIEIDGGLPYSDASAFEIDEWELFSGLAEDEEFALSGNVRRDFVAGDSTGFFKTGLKLRQREKFFDATLSVFEGGEVDGEDLTLANVQTNQREFPLADFGVFPSRELIADFFNSNRDSLEFGEDDSLIGSIVEDYEASEDIYAGYVMAGLDHGPFSITGGLRVEHTDAEATAFQVRDEEIGQSPNQFSDSYTDVLPSINAKFELTDDLLVRGALYRAIARPTFGAFAPRAEIEDIDGLIAEEGEGGNPNIKHQTADNFDLGIEWYLGDTGILSAGVFHKEIDDYIAEIQLIDANVFGLTIEEFNTFTNLDDATLTGVEFNYQQALDMLPAPLDGLIIGANLTLLDGDAAFGGEGTGAQARTIDLPLLSDALGNLVVGYDKGPIDLRLSYAYRSEYLDEINGGFDDGLDRFVDSHGQLDFTGRYKLTDFVRLYAEVKNITDEPFLAFTNVDGQKVLLQYEEYGYTANFGVKVKY